MGLNTFEYLSIDKTYPHCPTGIVRPAGGVHWVIVNVKLLVYDVLVLITVLV